MSIVQVLYPPILYNDVLGIYLEFAYTTNRSANTTSVSARFIVSKYQRYAPYYTRTATDPTCSKSVGWKCYVTINGVSGPAKRIVPFEIYPRGIHGSNGSNISNISISGNTGASSGGNSGTTDQTANVQRSNWIYLTDWYSRTLSHSSSGALTISITGQLAAHKYSGDGNVYRQMPTVNINASYNRVPSKPSAPSISFPSATEEGGKYFYGDVTYSVKATGSYTKFVVEPDSSYSANSGWMSSSNGSTKSWTVDLSNFPEGINVGGSVRCSNTSDGSTKTDYSITTSDYMRNYTPTATLPGPSDYYTYNGRTFIPTNASFSTTITDRGGWKSGYPQSRLQVTSPSGGWVSYNYQSGQGSKTFSGDISNIDRESSVQVRTNVTDGYAEYTTPATTYYRAGLDAANNIKSTFDGQGWVPLGSQQASFSWDMDNFWNWFDYAVIDLLYEETGVSGYNIKSTNITQTNSSSNSCSVSATFDTSGIPQGTRIVFRVYLYNKVGEFSTSYYPEGSWDNALKLNYPPSTPVLISPSNNEYFENTFTASWQPSTDQGGGTISYVIERYDNGNWVNVYSGSSTSTVMSLPSSASRGESINYRLYATDGLNNSEYVTFNVIKNTLPLVNQTDSGITVWNVSLDEDSNYVFKEATEGNILDQIGISFLPGSSNSTPENELRYRPYFKRIRDGAETIIEGSTMITRMDTPSVLSLSSYGINLTDEVIIMLAVVDKFGIQSNEDESITKDGYVSIPMRL